MSITRVWQTGFEHNDESEFAQFALTTCEISSAKAKTGTYSLRFSDGAVAYLHASTTAQAQASLYLNHVGIKGGASYAQICSFYNGATQVAEVRYYPDNTIRAFCGAGQVASAAAPQLAVQDTFFHIGVDVKIDETGWFSVWVDGVAEIAFSGDTTGGDTAISTFVVGNNGGSTTHCWNNYAYIDDAYWNDTAGEGAAAFPSAYRYYLVLPNDNGTYSDFAGSDGDSVDNYQMVDEIPPDGDVTYVTHDTDTEADSYLMANYTLPAGLTAASVIPVGKVRKENAGSVYGLKLRTRLSTNNSDSAKMTLGTGWGFIFDRQTTKPGGGAWAQADIDDMQVGVVVAS